MGMNRKSNIGCMLTSKGIKYMVLYTDDIQALI